MFDFDSESVGVSGPPGSLLKTNVRRFRMLSVIQALTSTVIKGFVDC